MGDAKKAYILNVTQPGALLDRELNLMHMIALSGPVFFSRPGRRRSAVASSAMCRVISDRPVASAALA